MHLNGNDGEVVVGENTIGCELGRVVDNPSRAAR